MNSSFDNNAFEIGKSKSSDDYQQESIEKDEEDKDSKALIKSFCKNTSGHGFVKVSESSNAVRWIWVIIMIITFIGLIIHLIVLIFRFLNYEVNSSFYVTPDNKLVMPDITACPNQRLYFVDDTDTTNGLSPDTTQIFNGTTFTELFNRYNEIWNKVVLNTSTVPLARYSIMRQTYNIKRLRGRHDLIIKLNYKGNNITVNNLLVTPTFDGFICVTFRPLVRTLNYYNGSDNTAFLFNLFTVGGNDRHEMAVRSLEEQQLPVGGMIYMHSPNSMPDLKSGGHYVNRGLSKQITFSQETIIRDNSNNVCFDNPNDIIIRGYGLSELNTYSYSRYLCIETKKSEAIYQNCGCRSEILLCSSKIPDSASFCHEIPSLLTTKVNNSFVSLDSIQINIKSNLFSNLGIRYVCHEQQIKSLENEQFSKVCLPSCTESNYKFEVSTVRMDRQNWGFTPIFEESIENVVPYILAENKSVDVLKAAAQIEIEMLFSMSVLKFIPKQFSVEITEESLSYPIESLLSDIGGILGLYLGFSVMSMLEIAELFVQLFIYNCITSKGKKN